MILWSEVMIKTLIIDDNKIIREYFQTMIDWEARGFSLCAVANNGIMGWQEFSRHRPDVVITDVQMPGMSGLELSRKIREVSPDTLIIFISSYDNFNYVKDALELGAFDYILKHENLIKNWNGSVWSSNHGHNEDSIITKGSCILHSLHTVPVHYRN